MINIGLVGFGKMGQIRQEAVVATGKGNVIVVYDPTPQDFRGIPSVDTAEAVIADPRVDAVFIATPNFRNRPLTIAALQAGKHVFCEKPPAFSGDEVKEIQRAEQASGRKLMYGFNHRHHRSIRAMKS
ncbi:MAG: Gfo/Idh/MocA family oxidoreductase, partial [Verrucomicrobiae bacterium]|nr:Gfo/Idh/MocA family oxidoreductase [Verrucomicrobiae bacterium]